MSSQEPPNKKPKQVENKQGTLLSWVKPCTSESEPGGLMWATRSAPPSHFILATGLSLQQKRTTSEKTFSSFL